MGLIPGIIKQIIKERERASERPDRSKLGTDGAGRGVPLLSPHRDAPAASTASIRPFTNQSFISPNYRIKKKLTFLECLWSGKKGSKLLPEPRGADGYQTVQTGHPTRVLPQPEPP